MTHVVGACFDAPEQPSPEGGTGVTVGKHAAADGASAHPLVAAALAQRSADSTGAHRKGDLPAASTGSGLGWPDPPAPDGGGLGWPGSISTDAASAEPEAAPAPSGPASAPATARGGWRRFFRVSSAA
jgi:hypothetical protein